MHTSFVVPKNSPLKVFIKYIIRRSSVTQKDDIFQITLDRYLGWLRDTGVIQKMVDDSVGVGKVVTAGKFVKDRPLIILRYCLN